MALLKLLIALNKLLTLELALGTTTYSARELGDDQRNNKANGKSGNRNNNGWNKRIALEQINYVFQFLTFFLFSYFSYFRAFYTYVLRKSPSDFIRLGWRSFLNAFASIWRMRSRVTLKRRPTSSNVRL